MAHPDDPVARLRTLSTSQLAEVGELSLREHVVAQAVVAQQKHGPLGWDNLEALLTDPECLRHPTRITFEFGEMAGHQFGQPDLDWRNQTVDGRVIYLRPILQDQPVRALVAAAYLIPVVNYGDVVSDDCCLAYGATLLGLMEDEYYRMICDVADFVGAEIRLPGDLQSTAPTCATFHGSPD